MAKKQTRTVTQKKKPISLKGLQFPSILLILFILGADIAYHQQEEALSIADAGFYGWFSMISCLLLVGAAYILKLVVKRNEKYYQREAEQS